jgi:hypothetical protein
MNHNLMVGESVLRRWLKKLTSHSRQAFVLPGQVKLEQQKIDRLRPNAANLMTKRGMARRRFGSSDAGESTLASLARE